jgi:uncharacterized protein
MPAAPDRIASLDLIRGVAVLGILLMNIVAFAMPDAAYFNPAAYGASGTADYLVWAINAVLVDGRMRGLFSFLFGASLLLVTDRAEAAGRSAASVHFRRMFWLFLFGLTHLFLVWWGDILHHYALVGCVAFFFRKLPTEKLLALAFVLLIVETVLAAGLPVAMEQASAAVHVAHPSAAAIAAYRSLQDGFGHPAPATLAHDLAAYRGSYAQLLGYRWPDALATPVRTLEFVGPETLAYMLLGMAGLKSGMLAGTWPRAAYRRAATWGFAIGVPGYAALACYAWQQHFAMEAIAWTALVLSTPLRPVMIPAWACLIVLLARPGGALTGRLQAAGRMAFTNYLATSLVCTTIFYGYGLGQYGHWTRAPLYLVVLAMWAAILLWSRPWLMRFEQGPLEWLWRSLARGRIQPMRRASVAGG